jgi:hypothetical protein
MYLHGYMGQTVAFSTDNGDGTFSNYDENGNFLSSTSSPLGPCTNCVSSGVSPGTVGTEAAPAGGGSGILSTIAALSPIATQTAALATGTPFSSTGGGLVSFSTQPTTISGAIGSLFSSPVTLLLVAGLAFMLVRKR